MGDCYHVIDEVSKSILGTFGSRGDAVDFVAATMSVSADDFLDELTIATDAGPFLSGDSLRDALRHRHSPLVLLDEEVATLAGAARLGGAECGERLMKGELVPSGGD